MSCYAFYDSCDAINWNDPLKCAWCENGNQSYALAQSASSACDNGTLYVGRCTEEADRLVT